MKIRTTDDQIRDYYMSQQLSPDTVARLKQRIVAGTPARSRLRPLTIVAAAILAIAGLFMWVTLDWMFQSPERFMTDIARQAALGHDKNQRSSFA